jgi:D-glycerate 3-kinase
MPEELPQWQEDLLRRHHLPPAYLAHAQQWFAPLAKTLAEHQIGADHPVLVAVNGSQGSGKTTVCDYLRGSLQADYGLAVVSLSLDDFYLTRAQRQNLAQTVHPLLATRGVPGTHDMTLLNHTLDGLLDPAAAGPVAIPRFDKALDDRRPEALWDRITGGVDLVLLEGWCMGARAQTAVQLAEPVNALERDEDPKGHWRNYVNAVLAREFEPLYRRVDQWVMLCAPSFDCVYRWRMEQEQKLAASAASGASDRIMDAAQVSRFIQYYQRLTDHCLEHLPAQVHHLYALDEQRQVTVYSQPMKLVNSEPGS